MLQGLIRTNTAGALSGPTGTDPFFSSNVLLMGFEGVNGSTGAPGMTDESPAAHGTALVNDGAHIDTAQFKFGSSSLNLDGLSDFISFADSPDWTLSSANSDQFTIELFVRFAGIAIPTNMFIGQVTGASRAWAFETIGVGGEFQFSLSTDGTTWTSTVVSSGAALTTGIQYFLAVDKDASGKIRIYKNGVMQSSATPVNSAMFNVNERLYIGSFAGGNGVNGWIDEMRVTKGVARYASDGGFTPPTAAFPRS